MSDGPRSITQRAPASMADSSDSTQSTGSTTARMVRERASSASRPQASAQAADQVGGLGEIRVVEGEAGRDRVEHRGERRTAGGVTLTLGALALGDVLEQGGRAAEPVLGAGQDDAASAVAQVHDDACRCREVGQRGLNAFGALAGDAQHRGAQQPAAACRRPERPHRTGGSRASSSASGVPASDWAAMTPCEWPMTDTGRTSRGSRPWRLRARRPASWVSRMPGREAAGAPSSSASGRFGALRPQQTGARRRARRPRRAA